MAHTSAGEDLDAFRPLRNAFEESCVVDGHTVSREKYLRYICLPTQPYEKHPLFQEYIIRISVPHRPKLFNEFRKRYNDFVNLNDVLSVYRPLSPLPPKTTFGNKEKILAERQVLLQVCKRSEAFSKREVATGREA